MNRAKQDANTSLFTSKSFLPPAIIGLLLGATFGFIVGLETAPLIGQLLVKPSVLILDPSAMLVGLIVIALCTLAGALLGTYVALRIMRQVK